MHTSGSFIFSVDPVEYLEQIGQLIDKKIKENLKPIMEKIGDGVPDTIKVKDVVVFTGYTEGYIYELVRSKAIPHFKLATGGIRFSRKEILIWVEAGRPHLQKEAVEQMAANYIVNGRVKKIVPVQKAAA